MPINANFEYAAAEKKFYEARTDEEKVTALEEMIRTMPQHKGAEALRANLRTRYKKIKEKIEKEKELKRKKKGGSNVFSIKKAPMQAVLVGLTNSGKSSLFKIITKANPRIASYGFTTQIPEVAILNYENCPIQIIDLPAIGADTFDTGIINTADTCLIVIEKLHEISEAEKVLNKFTGKRIIVFNKIDLYDENTKRKINETLKTKRYNFCLVSTRTLEGLEELKEKIFKSFTKIRVYTKQPGKEHDSDPVILDPGATVERIAKIVFHGKTNVIKKVRIWGPSSKFAGQTIGLKHEFKDKDIVEFTTG